MYCSAIQKLVGVLSLRRVSILTAQANKEELVVPTGSCFFFFFLAKGQKSSETLKQGS